MATVTGFTAARMLAIEADTVVSAAFNASGHLILTKHDGSQIDAGVVNDTNTATKGIVELATAAEVTTGTDNSRAVTPFGLATRALDPTLFTDATPPSSYPVGESYLSFTTTQGTTAAWGFGTAKAGTIRTYSRASAAGASQIFTRTHNPATTPETWFRGGDSGGWGTWKKVATTDDIVQAIVTPTQLETDLPAAYPTGISILNLSSSNIWPSFPSGYGTVVTHKIVTDRTVQTVYNLGGGTTEVQAYTRTYHSTNGGGGWSAWKQNMLMNNLAPASFTQTTAFTGYPAGVSRLYYTSATSSAWAGFSGTAGEVLTYRDGTDFARQTFIQHSGGSANSSGMMIRTANAANGWSAWNWVILDTRVAKLASATYSGKVSITPVANTPTFVALTFPAGRFSSAPNVVVTPETSVPGTTITGSGVNNVTATGCEIYITRTNNTVTNLYWIAMQN